MRRPDPWSSPRGAADSRPTGEVGPVVGTLAHLGAAFVAGNVVGILSPLANDNRATAGWILVALAGVVLAVAEVLGRLTQPVLRALYGFTAAVAAAYAAAGVGSIANAGGANDPHTALYASAAGILLAGGSQLRRSSAGTVAASALAVTALLLSAVACTEDPPRQAYAAALMLVSVGAFAAVALDRVRPPAFAWFAGVAAGAAASVVLVAEDPGTADSVTCIAVLVALGVLLIRQQVPVGVAFLALAAAADISLMAVAAGIDTGPALGPAIAGGLGAVIAADHERRAPIRPRLGGTYALCGLLVLVAAPFLTDSRDWLVVLAGAGCLLVLLGATAVVRRLVVAAAAVVELVAIVPDRFVPGAGGNHVREIAFIVAGLVVVVIAARTRREGPRPPAAVGHGDLPAGPSVMTRLELPYPEAFPQVLAAVAASGELQHVDRAAGRIATNDLAVAVWQIPGDEWTSVAVYGDEARARVLVEALDVPAGRQLA